MKMRCPKCGASFMVGKDGITLTAAAAASPVAAPIAPPPPMIAAPPPAAGSAFKAHAGVPSPVAAPQARSRRTARAAVPGVSATAAGDNNATKPAMPKIRTAVGVAPPGPGTDIPPGQKSPAGSLIPPPNSDRTPISARPEPVRPAARSRRARRAPRPRARSERPCSVPRPLPPRPRAPEPLLSSVELPDDLPLERPVADPRDLSVSRMYVDNLPAPRGEIDLPAPRAQQAAPRGAPPQRALPDPREFDVDREFDAIDLPAPKPAPAKATQYGGLDLPAPKPMAAKAPGAGRAPAPAAPTAFGELDLPTVEAVDLPTPKISVEPPGMRGLADLPAPRHSVDLPAPKGPGQATMHYGVADLPAPKVSADLPALRGVADLPAPKVSADLPALRGVADLPTPKFGADLPAPRVADLPAPRMAADLPAPRVADLPQLSGGFGDLELPTPKGEVPFGGLDLPGGSGINREEASFADIELPDLPPMPSARPGGGRGAFGDIDLPPPKQAADLIPPKAKTVQGMGGMARKPGAAAAQRASRRA